MNSYSSTELLKVKSEITQNQKAVTDFTSACDEIIPIARKVALEENGLDEAIDLLFHLEKLTRNAADMASTSRVLVEVVQLCAETNNWYKLNECIALLARRTTIKEAVTRMIQESMKYIEQIPNKETKLNLITTLRKVTEGKIFVEIERARLTKMLAHIMESEGNITGAAEVMGELKVETYGTMDQREKIKLILHQMRLYIAKEDLVQAQVLSQKILKKSLEETEQEDLKLVYYNLKIILDRDEHYLKTSQHYQEISQCSSVPCCSRQKMMGNAVLYCVLAPFEYEQKIMMETIIKTEIIKGLPIFKSILELFIGKELISIEEFYTKYAKTLWKYEVFNKATVHGKACWNELRNRIVEHNILTFATYYTRIHLERMSELLGVSKTDCEEHIARLVNVGMICVKIDRPLEIVNFTKRKYTDDILNDWRNGFQSVMMNINREKNLVNNVVCALGTRSETPLLNLN